MLIKIKNKAVSGAKMIINCMRSIEIQSKQDIVNEFFTVEYSMI